MSRKRKDTRFDASERLQYLQSLVTEYQDTKKQESKEQIVANLANFAYDASNFPHLRRLNVLGLFLDALTEPHDRLVEFGLGGLCNASVDPENRDRIAENGGIVRIARYGLSSPNEETVLSALGTLIQLAVVTSSRPPPSPSIRSQIESDSVVECATRFFRIIRFANENSLRASLVSDTPTRLIRGFAIWRRYF